VGRESSMSPKLIILTTIASYSPLNLIIAKQPGALMALSEYDIPSLSMRQVPVPEWKYSCQLFCRTVSETNFSPFPLCSGDLPDMRMLNAAATASRSVLVQYRGLLSPAGNSQTRLPRPRRMNAEGAKRPMRIQTCYAQSRPFYILL